MLEWLSQPWPWYISGPLLGLMVPLLLFFGNQHFGVSSTFRHICAAVLPLRAKYFRHHWRAEIWSVVLMGGVVAGALLAVTLLNGDSMPSVSEKAKRMFLEWGITDFSRLEPGEIFNSKNLFSLPNILMLCAGGFLVGFGTRYANGCTSGHGIMGLSLLNLGSLTAVVGFFIGGIPVSFFLVPLILSL